MRKFKFRMWDKNSGYFIKVSDTNKHYLSQNGDIIIIDEMGFIYETDKENYIINKYTGLKDSEGYEIYEGDIVKDVSDGIIGQIEYSDGGFVVIYDDIAEKLNTDESAYLEVIGNIFENPELIE